MARHFNQYPEAPAQVSAVSLFVCECMCIHRKAVADRAYALLCAVQDPHHSFDRSFLKSLQ
jgi:hypothetical protein